MATQQVFVQTKQNVSAGDINAISALIFQNFKDFNHNIFQDNDCVINGLQVNAPALPTTGAVTIKAGNAFYNTPNTTTTVPFANPVLTLSFKGSVVNIPTDVSQPINTPHATNQRTDAIDIQYTENQDTPSTRAFVQTNGTVTTSTVNTKTTSNVPITGGAGSVIVYTPGTPGTPTSSTPPAVPAGYIRLATVVVNPGGTFNIVQSNIVANGTAGTAGVTGTLLRIWEQETWPTGSNAPNVANTFDQSNTLADSLSAMRAQLNAIIGVPGGHWYTAPEISLHALTNSQSAFIKQGCDMRTFIMDLAPGNFPDDLAGGLNNKGIVIGRGMLGFPDGVIRRNAREKYIDFSQFYAPGFAGLSTTSQNTGTVDSFPVSQPGGSSTFLKVNTMYAVFAVADHVGTDFNVVCSEIPLVSCTISSSGGTVTATPSSGTFPNGFYVNRTIVRLSFGPTIPAFVWGPGTTSGGAFDRQDISAIGFPRRITGPGNVNTANTVLPSGDIGVVDMPQLQVATPTVLTTKGLGFSAPVPTIASTPSCLAWAIGGYKPFNFSRFRYLGSFLTDSTGRVYPFRREGTSVRYINPIQNFLNVYHAFNQAGDNSGYTVDMAGLLPGTATVAKVSARALIDSSSGAGGNGVQIAQARVYFRRNNESPLPPYPTMTVGTSINGGSSGPQGTGFFIANYGGDSIKQIDQPIVQGTFKNWVYNDAGIPFASIHGFIGDIQFSLQGYEEDIFDEWRRQ